MRYRDLQSKKEPDSEWADPHLQKKMQFAQAHYPYYSSPGAALTKLLVRGIQHSEEKDETHDQQLADLEREIFDIKKSLAKLSKIKKMSEQAGGTVAQRTAAYQQQLLDRMGARFELPPGSSLEQVKAAQLAYLDKNDPQAAAQARAGQPVQLAKRDPMQDPNFAQGLAAAKAGKGPLAIMLAQPDIANNQKYLDTIASSYGLPAGLTAQQIQAQADQKFARPAQPAAQPVGEVTGDRSFDSMMSKIKRGTKKQAAADRRERDAASRERARTAFGPSPADKLSIRPDKGVAEAANTGPHIVYATGPRTQGINDVDLMFKDIRKGKIVARVVGNNRHLQEFAPPSGGDRGDGGDGRDLPDRPPTYEIRMGDTKAITYVAFGDPEQDSEHTVYKLGPAKPGTPKYYGQGLTLVSELDWWSFLEKMIGEIMWEDDAIEAGYVDRLDNGDLVFAKQQGVAEGGYNPLADERREQSRMDAERAQFKRDELAAELGGEEQRAQQIMSGTWYIVIDGRVWRRGGQPVTFPGRDAARRAGQTIKNRTPERTVTITTKPISAMKEAKKDACYNKVRSRYRVWPSAYASGALVQCRKKGAKNWGDKSQVNEGWRETLAALAAAGVMAFSGGASAAGPAQDNANKITATITIDGDTKIMDLTNKNFRDVKEASRWLENFLDQRGIDNWGARIERGQQGSGVYQRANISSAGANLGAAGR